MKNKFTILLTLLTCFLTGLADTTGVQFGPTAEKEATFEKVTPLLDSPNLAEVEALCKQIAADGLNDALVRTKLFQMGQAVSMPGVASKYKPALETLFARYAKESSSPVQQLFFVEQLRWIGTKVSLPVVKELCESKDVNVAASANMTRQAIERVFDPPTQVYSPTRMRKLGEALAKADEHKRFQMLSTAVLDQGQIAYQAFAVRQIEKNLSPEYLKQWCDVARKCQEPAIIALLIEKLGSYQENAATELIFDMCGNEDSAVSAAALAVLSKCDTVTLQKALPSRLANVGKENYKALATFLSTLSADVIVPALSATYPEQKDMGKQLILETLAPLAGSESMTGEALKAAISPDSDKGLAKAAYRFLRLQAGAAECEKLLDSIASAKGSLQEEAIQAYAMAARIPGNEVYGEKLLQKLKKDRTSPSPVEFQTASRLGSLPLLDFVCSNAENNKDALRALSTWRDGLAAPYLMDALAKNPSDLFLVRSVRQQLQSTMADSNALTRGWKTLAACGKISIEDLKDFAVLINRASNIALNRPVTATRPQEGDRAPLEMVDGKTGNGNGYWSRGSPVEITVDLESVRKVGGARIFFYADGSRYYQYRVDTSADNKVWQLAVDKTKDTSVSRPEGFLLSFSSRQARYVKLTITKNSSNPSTHVNELMLFSGSDAGLINPDDIKASLPGPDKDGFYTLFDGSNLSAWEGNKTAYYINENRELAVDPSKGGSGNLYTSGEYDNFIYRFEFKLTPGANNGIGLRTAKGDNAAYAGFEIQVLDNSAEKYNKLQPYQYHGSVYGIIPAKKGAQKTVGEWNSEEIVLDERHVKVTLNGQVIVDADLDEASRNGTMDHKEHPGLKRTTGHISFCGHGDKLWFRNIKVKPLR